MEAGIPSDRVVVAGFSQVCTFSQMIQVIWLIWFCSTYSCTCLVIHHFKLCGISITNLEASKSLTLQALNSGQGISIILPDQIGDIFRLVVPPCCQMPFVWGR